MTERSKYMQQRPILEALVKLLPDDLRSWVADHGANSRRSASVEGLRRLLDICETDGLIDSTDEFLRWAGRRLTCRPCSLYRLSDAHDVLLYVGITTQGVGRFNGHASTKSWWATVASARFEHFSSVPAALNAEAKAIRTEHPKFNISLGTEVDPSVPEATEVRKILVETLQSLNQRAFSDRRIRVTLAFYAESASQRVARLGRGEQLEVA